MPGMLPAPEGARRADTFLATPAENTQLFFMSWAVIFITAIVARNCYVLAYLLEIFDVEGYFFEPPTIHEFRYLETLTTMRALIFLIHPSRDAL